VVLAASTALLAVGLLVTALKLRGARREIDRLSRRTDRSRLVPSPTDAVRTVVGTAMKVRDHGFSGALRSSIDELALWADVERPDLARLASTDGSVTILFSDIEGSTEMTERLGDRRWLEVLREHNTIVRSEVRAHGGFEVKSQGDGFMVAFSSARRAVDCAIAVQRAFAARAEESSDEAIRVRIGMHTGEAIRERDDFFGRNVILAARIAAQADGGEVLVSSLLKELTESSGDIAFGEVREVALKGLSGSYRLHSVDWEGVGAGAG
jgi:adenylate cyclase